MCKSRFVCLFLFCMLMVGCASTAERVNPVAPDDALTYETCDDEGNCVVNEPVEPETATPPSANPSDSNVNFAYPEGWTVRPIPERNGILLVDQTETATLMFGILSPESGRAYDQVERIWNRLSGTIGQEGGPAELTEPAMQVFDGVETTFMIARGSGMDGTPVTQVWIAFESNQPGLDIMVIGTWPQSRDEEMMEVLRMVAQSIRIGEPSPGQPVAPAPPTQTE